MTTELAKLQFEANQACITSTPFILLDNAGVPFEPLFRNGKTTGEIRRSHNPVQVRGFSRANADHLAANGNGVTVIAR